MKNEKIERDLLILFEDSVGYEFRVKGTPLVDVCTGVDKDKKMVCGQKYGDFSVSLCELTGKIVGLRNHS